MLFNSTLKSVSQIAAPVFVDCLVGSASLLLVRTFVSVILQGVDTGAGMIVFDFPVTVGNFVRGDGVHNDEISQVRG